MHPSLGSATMYSMFSFPFGNFKTMDHGFEVSNGKPNMLVNYLERFKLLMGSV